MKSKKTGIAVKIALTAFTLFCIVTLFVQKIQIDDLNSRISELSEKNKQKEAYNEKLKNRLNSEMDDDYVEDIAKDKLNLVLPEEIIFYNDIAG
ncbi:MAG: hypothetical protein E7578_00820 [Ruminococcaceae bacterium]|nr:hypothetical protein [Oscillospiraceae bacterium]